MRLEPTLPRLSGDSAIVHAMIDRSQRPETLRRSQLPDFVKLSLVLFLTPTAIHTGSRVVPLVYSLILSGWRCADPEPIARCLELSTMSQSRESENATPVARGNIPARNGQDRTRSWTFDQELFATLGRLAVGPWLVH